MKEEKIGVHSLARNILGVKGVCWSFGMGTRMCDKWVNYSCQFAQTKQQVGYYIVEAFLMHGRTTSIHGFKGLTMAWIWGKPSPSPL